MTSDFAKGMQTDLNHYVIRDRINIASFRQKLDPIRKDILQRHNSFELIFGDIPTFDAENPIAGSLLKEIDVKKKGTDSDLIKNLPNQPGKEFEIRKILDRIKGLKRFPKDNNNNNNTNDDSFLEIRKRLDRLKGIERFPKDNNDNNNNDDEDNFPPPVVPVSPPYIDPFPPPDPCPAPGSKPGFCPSSFNPFQQPLPPPSPSTDAFPSRGRYDSPPPPPPAPSINNFPSFTFGTQPSSSPGLFGSQTVIITRQKEDVGPKNDISIQIDDSICELPDQPNLELGDGSINTLGVEANDLLDSNFITKQEKNDVILEQIKQDFNFDEIKDTLDQGTLYESIKIFLRW